MAWQSTSQFPINTQEAKHSAEMKWQRVWLGKPCVSCKAAWCAGTFGWRGKKVWTCPLLLVAAQLLETTVKFQKSLNIQEQRNKNIIAQVWQYWGWGIERILEMFGFSCAVSQYIKTHFFFFLLALHFDFKMFRFLQEESLNIKFWLRTRQWLLHILIYYLNWEPQKTIWGFFFHQIYPSLPAFRGDTSCWQEDPLDSAVGGRKAQPPLHYTLAPPSSQYRFYLLKVSIQWHRLIRFLLGYFDL